MRSFRNLFALAAAAIVIGAIVLWAGLQKTIRVDADGRRTNHVTYAGTVGAALRQVGLVLSTADRVTPGLDEPLVEGALIRVHRAHPVVVWADGRSRQLQAQEGTAEELLAAAGLDLEPDDGITFNGAPVLPGQALTLGETDVLQVHRAATVRLREGSWVRTFRSTAATLGQALWEAGVQIHEADRLTPGPETALNGDIDAELLRAREVSAQTAAGVYQFRTTAQTVGEALAEAGLPLQGLDYSRPAEGAPLPPDGQIRVVRVSEEVLLEQEPLAFETELQPDPTLEIDQRAMVEPGSFGISVSRVRIRYEDQQEVSRQREEAWVAVPPKPRIMGYGTNIQVRTLDTPGGPIEYWRAVTMYATSYSPCRIFRDRCSYITASGAQLRKGVAAVVTWWYWTMGGSQVYVPGYGVATILDTGLGIPGRNWIDLGYSDDDFVSWHQWVTVYFLTPVPSPDRILYQLN